MLSTITSVGKPVLVGGPPTIDMFALAMKFGLKGLGKMWKKLGDKFQDLIDRLRKKGKNRLADILQPIKCKTFGEPVDAATGRVYHTNVDFELPGPIPIVWERTYYSDAAVDGPLGYNWHHSYNLGVRRLEEGLSSSAMPTDGSLSCPCWNRRTPILTVRNNCSGRLTGRVTC